MRGGLTKDMKISQNFFLFLLILFCQGKICFSQDTTSIYETKIVSFPCAPESTFTVIDSNKRLDGYIVFEFDSTKYSQLQNKSSQYLSTYIYFVNNLSDIKSGTKYFLNPYTLVFSGFLSYLESNDTTEIMNNHFHIDTSFFNSDQSQVLKRILTDYKIPNHYFNGLVYEDLYKYSEPLINEALSNRVFFIVKGNFVSAIFRMKCHLNFDESNKFFNGDNYFLLPLSELKNMQKEEFKRLKKAGFHNIAK